MKYNDYRRLGKISISSRKKSTRTTVRGISFGLIILIPLVFFAIAFYLDLTNKINEIESIASFNITTKHYTDDSGDSIVLEYNYNDNSKYPMLGFNRLEPITSLDGVSDYLVSEYFNIPQLYQKNYSGIEPPQTSLILGDEKIPLNYEPERYDEWRDDIDQLSTKFKILHPDRSSSPYITKAEENDLLNHFGTNNFLIAGEGFKGDGKQQIMLSERFISQYNLDVEDIINKKISLELIITESYNMLIDFDNDPNNEFDVDTSYNYFFERISGKGVNLFIDYEVVGIISNNLYKLHSREQEADIWFHSNSLYNDEMYFPEINTYTIQIDEYYSNTFTIATYPTDPLAIALEVTDEGNLFIPIGMGGGFGSIDSWDLKDSPILVTLIQCDDYHSATVVEGSLNAIYNMVYGENYYNITNYSYFFFSMIYKTGLYIIIVLLAFGGIIFFATLLNLYNSINYSVQSRRNYIGVMRAIGSRESVIPRLYFVEIMLIFMRAFVWILIFSGLISYGIKALIDSGFNEIAEDLGLALKLNFMYFPVTIIIMVLIEFTIAFIYSQVACRNVSKKPILEILKDEK